MASEVVTTAGWWPTTVALLRDSYLATVAFLRDSYLEIRTKTTWPDVPQVRQASIAIIIFVLAIGMLISLLDVLLNLVLVNFIPSLFA